MLNFSHPTEMNPSDIINVFPQRVKDAAHWLNKEIFQSPYPWLTPWLDRTVSMYTKGICPKQLANFEIELDCGNDNIVQRPNHGMVHSLRVANYIAQVGYLFKKYSTDPKILAIVQDENEIEILQIMMLFSVSGRVNEAGGAFYDDMDNLEQILNNINYEASRQFSADNFKRYCLEKNLIDINSEKFKTYYHALRFMEQGDEEEHQWNPYITLMGCTHNMDLLRCFSSEEMKNLHRSFQWHFKEHPIFKAQETRVRTDIFRLLKNAENSQYFTGNRIITGINEEDQTYEDLNLDYDYDLFFKCTQDIDYTMEQLLQLQIANFEAMLNDGLKPTYDVLKKVLASWPHYDISALLSEGLDNLRTLIHSIQYNDPQITQKILQKNPGIIFDAWDYAMKNDDAMVGQVILATGYEVSIVDLEISYYEKHTAIFSLLLEHGLKIDYEDLENIVRLNAPEINSVLIQHQQSIPNETLEMAKHYNDMSIMNFLLEHDILTYEYPTPLMLSNIQQQPGEDVLKNEETTLKTSFQKLSLI